MMHRQITFMAVLGLALSQMAFAETEIQPQDHDLSGSIPAVASETREVPQCGQDELLTPNYTFDWDKMEFVFQGYTCVHYNHPHH